jgi:hypothetical protein
MSTDQILPKDTHLDSKPLTSMSSEVWNTLSDSHPHITLRKETAVGRLPRLSSIHNRKVEVAKELKSSYSMLIP